VTQNVAQTFRRFGADEWDALRTRFNAGAPMDGSRHSAASATKKK